MSLSINNNLMARNTARNLNAHYSRMAESVQRFSSGLRVNSAADDAAGLAIRELMRADISTLHQGIRNANDAISMIQTADGALSVIDEKLIRMKELAEQAATGTYDSTQRLIIDSEFQQMALEIERIARATDFNGVKLLDGSLSGPHDGSGLTSTGKLKVHFGTANDEAEDYYYVDIGDCTLEGLGLTSTSTGGGNGGSSGADGTAIGTIPILSEKVNNNTFYGGRLYSSGIISFAIIPTGTKNLRVKINDTLDNDTIELFTRSGTHLAGTPIGWHTPPINKFPEWELNGVTSTATMESLVLTEENGFYSDAVYDGTMINGDGNVPAWTDKFPYNTFTYNGMQIGYSGEGNAYHIPTYDRSHQEFLSIDEVTEDLVLLVVGTGVVTVGADWSKMPLLESQTEDTKEVVKPINIQTQENAQNTIEKLDNAIVKKDTIRAHLGAMQNRLENTVTNLSIQAENLQAAESRISDTDVATEMTAFVRNRILTQSAVTMLGQANSLPQMLVRLIGG